MDPNQNPNPIFRQWHMERCRQEMALFSNYQRHQQQYGCPAELPQFNQYGQIVNMPPNLRRIQFPTVTVHPPNQFFVPNAPQLPYNANSFSLSFTLSQDLNSPGQLFFEQFGHHPTLPPNRVPKHVVFVYENSEAPVFVPQQNVVHHVYHVTRHVGASRPTVTVDAAVGDSSVVRYNQETQTEWRQPEQRQAADNQAPLHNALMQRSAARAVSVTSNLSQPEEPEFNTSVTKVSQWLKMTQRILASSNQPGRQLAPTSPPALRPPPRNAYQHMKTMPAPFFHQPPPPPPQIIRKIPFHGSQAVGDFKKRGVQLTIVKHSTVKIGMDAERARDVVVDGDDTEKPNEKTIVVVLRDSETPNSEANETPVNEPSVAENRRSVSNGVQADTSVSQDEEGADESQKESAQDSGIADDDTEDGQDDEEDADE
ncbi:unnamed protein product [Caenorhabditis brenneri]